MLITWLHIIRYKRFSSVQFSFCFWLSIVKAFVLCFDLILNVTIKNELAYCSLVQEQPFIRPDADSIHIECVSDVHIALLKSLFYWNGSACRTNLILQDAAVWLWGRLFGCVLSCKFIVNFVFSKRKLLVPNMSTMMQLHCTYTNHVNSIHFNHSYCDSLACKVLKALV